MAAGTGEVRGSPVAFWRSSEDNGVGWSHIPQNSCPWEWSPQGKKDLCPIRVQCAVESGAQLSASASGAAHRARLFSGDLQQPKCSPM